MNTTYDIVHLAENEWSNTIMREVAEQWFKDHPDCQFVQIYEHAGWWLAYHRADLECIGTANTAAVMRPDRPRPTDFSGVEQRREVRARFEGRNVESLADYAASYDPCSHPYDPSQGDDMGEDLSWADADYERQCREELAGAAV